MVERTDLATAVARVLFVGGAFGLAIPLLMVVERLELRGGTATKLFPDASPLLIVGLFLGCLAVMVIGENVGKRYGDVDSGGR